ncbi:LRR and CARD domains-containing protein 3) (Nucleotide-binding oligomerization domain protein 3), partial [Durusdinium trenchii]
GAIALAEALKVNKTVEVLKFVNPNRIGPKGAKALAEALRVNTEARLPARRFQSPADIFPPPHVFDINSLLENEIGNEGATALAKALPTNRSALKVNQTVTMLKQVSRAPGGLLAK